MIIDNKDAKQELLYTGYGFTVYGKIADYEWTYDGSGRREKCLTTISINDADNKEIYNKYLGNNCIFMRIFNENIDNILWYLDKETIDTWMLDNNIIQKVLINNDNLFSRGIQQRKDKEKQEAENNRLNAELEMIQNEQRKDIQNYCNKKKLYCKFTYSDLYVFKINKDFEKVTELLNNADSKHLESYVDYAKKYPNNELTLVYVGSNDLNTMLTELKQVA